MARNKNKSKAPKPMNTTKQPPNRWQAPWLPIGGTSITSHLSIVMITILAVLFIILLVGSVEAHDVSDTSPIHTEGIATTIDGNSIWDTPSDPPPLKHQWTPNDDLATVRPGRGVASDKPKNKSKSKPKKPTIPKTNTDKMMEEIQDRYGSRTETLLTATRDYCVKTMDINLALHTSNIEYLHDAISKDGDDLHKIEYIEQINTEAWTAVREGRGFIVVKKALDLICIDNDAVKSSHLLAAGAALIRKIHHFLNGTSQTGKTWIQVCVGELLPNNRVLLLDDMTPTSLKHDCRADPTYLKGKVIILDEWSDLHPGVARFFKKILNYKKERGRFKWTDKKHNSVDIFIEGMPLLFTNACDLDNLDKSTFIQLMNRCVVCSTVDTQDYRDAILQLQQNERWEGPIMEREKDKFDVAKKIMEIVMSDEMSDMTIVNPFVKFMTDEMEDGVIHQRKLLDIADSSAFWNRWTNHKEGNLLFVEAKDMLLASWIFQHLEAHTSRHIDDKCIEIFKAMDAGRIIEHRDLCEMFKDTPGLRSPHTVKDRCERLVDAGLIQKEKGNENIQDADGKIIRYRNYIMWRPIEDPQYIDDLLPSGKVKQPLCNRYAKCFLPHGDFDESHLSKLIDIIYSKLIKLNSTVKQSNSTIHTNTDIQRKAEEIANDIISNPLSLCDSDSAASRCRVYKGEETLAPSGKNNFDSRFDSRLPIEENVTKFVMFVNESDKIMSHEVIRKKLGMSREELKAVELELRPEDNSQVVTRDVITIFVDWKKRKAVGQSPLRRKVEDAVPIRLSNIHNALENYSGFIGVVTGYAVDHEWVMFQFDEDDGDTILVRYEDREDLLTKQVGESEDDETDGDKMFGEN